MQAMLSDFATRPDYRETPKLELKTIRGLQPEYLNGQAGRTRCPWSPRRESGLASSAHLRAASAWDPTRKVRYG